jgi:hypothetical protein
MDIMQSSWYYIFMFLVFSTGIIVGCYYWYNSSEDKASRAFSIIVPIFLIGMLINDLRNILKNPDIIPRAGKRKLR